MSILSCPIIGSQNSTGGSVSGIQLFPNACTVWCVRSVLECWWTMDILCSFMQQWFVSGNINCFDGWHAPLGILAMLSLAFCVSIVVFLYAFRWLEVSVRYLSGCQPTAVHCCTLWVTSQKSHCMGICMCLLFVHGDNRVMLYAFLAFNPLFQRPRWIWSSIEPLKEGTSTQFGQQLNWEDYFNTYYINVLTMLLLRNTKTLTEGLQALEEPAYIWHPCRLITCS